MTRDTTTAATASVPLAPARPAGRLGATAAVLALVVLGIAVLLVQDGLSRLGVLRTPAWTETAAAAVGTVRPTWPVAVVGVVLALAGLAALTAALRPRRREGVELRTRGGVVVLDGDVARLASAAAATVPGVLRARTVRTRRAVVVDVVTDDRDGARSAVHDAVTHGLALLADPPRVDVRARGPQPGAAAPQAAQQHRPAEQHGTADAREPDTTEVTR